MLSGISDWATRVIDTLGYGGVAFLVALENLFPPIPSELVLPLAGYTAGRGQATLIGMILAATLGSIVGAWILYGVASAIGPERLRRLVVRYGKWVRISTSDLDKTEAWFDNHSGRAVLICRCVPLVRSLISIPAGFRRMSLAMFTLYTLIGSLVWNSALIGAGYLLGDNYTRVESQVGYFQKAVIAVIVIAVVWFVWTRFASPKARRKKTTV